MQPKTLDHVAFWVADRAPIVAFLERHVGMHVIAQEENFTLLGSDARRGKLTLFDADGPREQGALKHVALRVSDLAAARARSARRAQPDVFDAGEGICADARRRRRPTSSTTSTTSRSGRASPAETAREYERYGFAPAGAGRVEVGGAFIVFHEGDPGEPERPLLNHLAVLVDSADDVIADAGDLGIEVESVVDAANTYAAFLWGPERVRIEYVEHKPTFSLT